jgi:hypothetical protein
MKLSWQMTEDTESFKIWTKTISTSAEPGALQERGKERRKRSLRRPPRTDKTPNSDV